MQLAFIISNSTSSSFVLLNVFCHAERNEASLGPLHCAQGGNAALYVPFDYI